MQRLTRDGGRQAAESEAAQAVPTQLLRRELQKQACGQRAVHHQPAIALDLFGIRRIIVDAVGVEGQRRIAEQQPCIGDEGAVRVPSGGVEHPLARCWRRERRIGRGGLSVDQRLRLDHRDSAVGLGHMFHIDKGEAARSALLLADRNDLAGAFDHCPDRNGGMEGHLARCPHPARPRTELGKGRQEAVRAVIARRVPVLAQLGGRRLGGAEREVDALRHDRGMRAGQIEGGEPAVGQPFIEPVLGAHLAPDPRVEVHTARSNTAAMP